MDMFAYVMVLISLIIGLAMTQLLQGLASMIQHPERARAWSAHLLWVAFVFILAVFWWWWEFRYQELEQWTFPLYLFVIAYAFVIYLLAAMLFPNDLEGYQGYKHYFLAKRRWFFGLLAAAALFDCADSRLKGAEHFASLGLEYFFYLGTIIAAAAAGAWTRNAIAHVVLAVILFAYQLTWAVRAFDDLG